ncbi:hypothetical protein NDU88_004675 [Pleurodeles waltl]|uniref:Uncharacterized protein n=1 Tax=Pleurodeles waltl TaxID=8319 RepID=A0AAV7L5D1_PLEWA|nr:hypothetical protein NDU88_004675 [Pleurodeles waltl]
MRTRRARCVPVHRYTLKPLRSHGSTPRFSVAPTAAASGSTYRGREWGANRVSARRAGLRSLPQRPPRDRATKLTRRRSFTPAPPIISARGARRWLKPASFTRRRSLSARRRIYAGRVIYCVACQLHERSGLLSAPSSSRQDALRSSGVPPPQIIGACLSSVCRCLDSDFTPLLLQALEDDGDAVKGPGLGCLTLPFVFYELRH